jgi:hypothetical protein
MIFDRFRKNKKDDILPASLETTAELPEDLERFRMRPPEVRYPEARPEVKNDYPVPEVPYGKSVEDLVSERTQGDKIELILQKLETIDARLRLMEEKLKR